MVGHFFDHVQVEIQGRKILPWSLTEIFRLVGPASINANHVDLDFSNFQVPWSDGRTDPHGSSLRSELVRRRHLDPDYHRAALDGLKAARATRAWETESILAAIREFYSCHKRVPRQDEFRNSNGLPGYSTLLRRFGSGKRAIELALDRERLRNL